MTNPNRPSGATIARFVRYTADLAPLRRLYVDALGMTVQFEAAPRAADHPDGPEHGMLMAGFLGSGWHIEWVEDAELAQAPDPRLDELILYLGGEASPELLHQVEDAGATIIPGNPYWEQHGVTFVDPDGHRTVLTSRTWSGKSWPRT